MDDFEKDEVPKTELSSELSDSERFVWLPQMEIALFQAMGRNKPVGIHKHFRMANIVRLYNANSPVKCTASDIWEYLGELFNLDFLDELEDESEEGHYYNGAPDPFAENEFSLDSYEFNDPPQEEVKLETENLEKEHSPTPSSADTSAVSTPEPEGLVKRNRRRVRSDSKPSTPSVSTRRRTRAASPISTRITRASAKR
ncbi:hypothetical protein K493DRAFT_312277 [Basidiobolus meristosporus CBS 931.73]|uniref:CT20-domain-containing protein n=1 Tax=Basidiobolus meristosporus CBS 931.73 TaxID=1314790 RepID=A0A1Y1YUV2_9FUNG|nr:hypothetical protein K493DRAFT_312277 [Basidiobolus meristosporus CBS 931.73]|eukprot:ORY01759.1 hypothetical protein K493DRAFT_312277 [Basidiobolus meristosporus CBS 931.73]